MTLLIPVSIGSGARPLTPQDDIRAAVAMSAMFGIPALGMAYWLIHCRIVADARGLTFHNFFVRRVVAWPEIEDFELRIPTSNQSKTGVPRAFVKSGGQWRLLPEFYQSRQELRDCIEREAKWARAKSWQLGEIRDDGEWPKTFEYRDESGWKLVGVYLGMSLLFFSQFFTGAITTGFAPIFANIALIWSGLSPWGRALFVAMPLLLCGSTPLVFLVGYPAIKARRRYLGQKVVASREGIALFRDARKISIAWDEITSYHLETLPGHFQPDLCVIEAEAKRIEFVTGIRDTKSLLALVQNRAKNASTSKWLHKHGVDEDVLGGAASLYRGGNVGIGPKIHHYRNRTSRAMLVFGLVLMVGGAAPLVTGHRNNNGIPTTKADIVMGIFFLSCLIIPYALGLVGWLKSSLQCEENGLRHNSVWGERFLCWDEIEKLIFNGYYWVVSGQKSKIRFGMVADYKGLCAEIEKRSGVECKRDGNAV